MNKFLSLSFLLLLLVSCGETSNEFDTLPQAEKDALLEREKLRCLSDNQADLNDFKVESQQAFGLLRGEYFQVDVKRNGTLDPDRTVQIQFWKVTSDTIYLLITNKYPSTSFQFIKITKALNLDMIDFLYRKSCTLGNKNIVASSNSSQISYKETYSPVPKNTTQNEVTTLTTIANYDYLSFFANYNYTKVVQTLTKEGGTTSEKDRKDEAEITMPDDIEFANSTYSGYTGAQFCIVKFTAGTPNEYKIPFELDCGDSTSPKFPLAELNIP